MDILNIVCLFSLFVFVQSCDVGWLQHGTQCYAFSDNTMTWIDAVDECRAQGAKLVEIEDGDENKFVKIESSKRVKFPYWIGLSDLQQDGHWVWFESQTELAGGFTDWYPGDPNNMYGDENCVALFKDLGYSWIDMGCHYSIGYICEKPNNASTGSGPPVGR